MQRHTSGHVFWLVMAALLAVETTKHVLAFSTGPTRIIYDSQEYWERGDRARHGDWLQLADDVDYRTPLYPIFLGVMQSLFGTYALCAVAIVQHLLQMLSGLLTASTCWVLTRSRVITAAAYALSVACVTESWYANVALTGPLFAFLMTALLRAIAGYTCHPTAGRLAGVGALLAAATLVRPIPQMLWFPIFGLVLIVPRLELRQRFQHVLAATLVMAVILAPAMVRNYVNHDRPYVAKVPPINKWVVCFHDQSAANLPIPKTPAGQALLALLPDLDTFDPEIRNGYGVLERLQKLGLSNMQIDELITATCFDAVRENPGTFAWKAFKRLGNFWRTSVHAYPYYSTYAFGDSNAYYGQAAWRIEPVASWFEVVLRHTFAGSVHWLELDFVACMLGTFFLIRRRETRFFGLVLAVIFVYFPAITALLEVESFRYRYVLEHCIVVAIVAGLFGQWVTRRGSADDRGAPAPSLVTDP